MEVAQEASQRGDEQLGARAAQALGLAHDDGPSDGARVEHGRPTHTVAASHSTM